jgi:succinate dehydrogenase / fumarate reductase cytochrome b subunit
MNLAKALFTSSIGRKILMALTGLVLVGFVTGHLVGNLHLFGSPDEINGYAHFLQGLGPVLWLIRGFLLLCVVLHIWAGVVLTLENNKARPVDYGFKHTIQATLASRAMRVSGIVVLAFLLYHLAHFTVGANSGFFQGQSFKTRIPEYVMKHDFHFVGLLLVRADTPVHDVHTMIVRGFQSPIVSGFYILAVGLLAFHLWHGVESMFQTLGLKTSRWGCMLRLIARAFCVVYFLGNLTIPTAILAGCVGEGGMKCHACSSCSAPADAATESSTTAHH